MKVSDYSRDAQHVCHVQVDGSIGPPGELCPGAARVGQGVMINGVTGVRLLQDPLPGEDLIDDSDKQKWCLFFFTKIQPPRLIIRIHREMNGVVVSCVHLRGWQSHV